MRFGLGIHRLDSVIAVDAALGGSSPL
jgi:hypothetical protein